jgi:mannose-6-phosphate isomerase
MTLRKLIARAPEHLLGPTHVQRHGREVGFLTKLLDAGMRLHLQAHPTAAFAQQHLGSPHGKLEAYLILGVRDGGDGALTLGFQHDPGPDEWRRIVLEQDLEAMAACFEPIPVAPGELWFVPGGVPHAIGKGLLVVEIMEPSDLVVRCEFERDGLIVPPDARFMGRDPDLALQIFRHESWSVAETRRRLRVEPTIRTDADGVRHEVLFDARHSPCFEVQRVRLDAGRRHRIDTGGRLAVVLGIQGRGRLAAGDERLPLNRGGRRLVAAAAGRFELVAQAEPVTTVVCFPRP